MQLTGQGAFRGIDPGDTCQHRVSAQTGAVGIPQTRGEAVSEAVQALPELLAPSTRAAVAEMDTSYDVPAKLHQELREAGAFRLLTPLEFGGSETPLTTTMALYERLG